MTDKPPRAAQAYAQIAQAIDYIVAQYPAQPPLAEIAARIGAGAAPGSVFESREPTGEICTPERFQKEPERDWILTRILWLRGLEPGRNQGGDVDSERRFIYIHGTPDEARIGAPHSHGCIRMRNADVVELFDRVAVGTPVEIVE